jgi:hypothetical protein
LEPRISFITLGVSDLERSIRFYVDVLGLAPLPSPPPLPVGGGDGACGCGEAKMSNSKWKQRLNVVRRCPQMITDESGPRIDRRICLLALSSAPICAHLRTKPA